MNDPSDSTSCLSNLSPSALHSQSRRQFLIRAGLAISAPIVLPGRVLGLEGAVSPSNKTTAALVGVGCLGRGHLNNLAHLANVELLGISDVDQWRLNDGDQIVKKAAEEQKKTNSCKLYHDFPELLERADVDAMVYVMGDRWHATVAKMTARKGKDVFVEKPCALTVDECMSISEVVRANRRICQVGLQQRSDRCFNIACNLVRSGRLGKISHVYVVHESFSREVDLPSEPIPATLDWERWLGPCPWRGFNHRFHYLGFPKNVVPWEFVRDFGNGGIASGGVHAWDVVNWGLGMEYLPGPCYKPGTMSVEGKTKPIPQFPAPLEVYPIGTSDKYKRVTFKFPNGVVAQIVHGRIDQNADYVPPGADGLPVQSFGAFFVGEKGWIHVGRRNFLKASDPALLADAPEFVSCNHLGDFIESVRTRKEPNCPIERGCEATLMTTIGSMAQWLERPLFWDYNKQEFVNDSEANRLRKRTPRGNWVV